MGSIYRESLISNWSWKQTGGLIRAFEAMKKFLYLGEVKVTNQRQTFLANSVINKKAVFLQLVWFAMTHPSEFYEEISKTVDGDFIGFKIPKIYSKKFLNFMKAQLYIFNQRVMSKQSGELFKTECGMKELKIEGLGSGEGVRLCLYN